MSTTAVRIGGEHIGVRVDAAALLAWLARTYRTRPADSVVIEVAGREVRRRGRLLHRARSSGELRAWLEWAITSEALARLRRRTLILHAAWVSRGKTSALIAGRHGAGKTTLALALELRHGWRVLSDDVVLFGDEGPRPLERPVSVKPGTALPELGRAARGGWPSLLPRRVPRRLPRVTGVFLIDGRRTRSLNVAPISGGRAVAAIGRFFWNFTSRPREALAAAARAAECGSVWKIRGGGIDERCVAVERMLHV